MFTAEYISGEARSDNDENSEAVWVDVNEAMNRDDVPDLTKKILQSVTSGKNLFDNIHYEGNTQNGAYYFYGLE